MALAPTVSDHFRTHGFAGPFSAIPDHQLPALRSAYFARLGVDEKAPGPSTAYLSAWHHQSRWAYDLASNPSILDRVEEVLGPNILLWAMHAWYKEPGSGKSIPWHHDAGYWPMEPAKNVTAWIALDHCNRENGCLRIIPGSQSVRPPNDVAINDPNSWFPQAADPKHVDETAAMDVTLAPGEFVLFDEGILHGSKRNFSTRPRLALSCRYTSPDVRFLMERWTDPDRIRTFLVRGRDELHLNDEIRGTAP